MKNQKEENQPPMSEFSSDAHLLSLSDPICTLFIRDEDTNLYHEMERTEMVKDDLDPIFSKIDAVQPQRVTDDLGYSQLSTDKNLRFVIMDIDSEKTNLQNDDLIGIADWNIYDLVKSPDLSITLPITIEGNKYGEIFIVGEYINDIVLGDTVSISCGADDIPRMDFFSKADPFFIIKRKLKTQNEYEYGGALKRPTKHVVYVSEAKLNTHHPLFRKFKLPINHLCNGDLDHPLTVEFYDWNSTTKKSYIGEFDTTVRKLMAAKETKEGRKIPLKKLRGRGGNLFDHGYFVLFDIEFSPLAYEKLKAQDEEYRELKEKYAKKSLK